jgi:flagellar hook-associated protein 2
MAIGVSGLMSGLDTGSIISQMMQLERRPIMLLQRQEAGIQARISAMGSLKSGLAGLQTAARALKSASGYTKMQATSGNSEVLAATASSTAVAGKYQVEVAALATAQQVRSAAFAAGDAVAGTGTLTIQVGSGAATEITIDENSSTLAGIAGAINNAGAGVTAGVIHDGSGNYYLTLAAGETGSANTISLSMTDDDGNNNDDQGLSALYTDPVAGTLTQTLAAGNARMSVNGIAVERSGNTISDLIEGVTITLRKADEGNPFELLIARNSENITGNVKEFVKQYNTLVDTLKRLRGYNPETKQAGLLQGDSLTRQAEGQVRALLHRQFGDSAQSVRRLSDLGISVDKEGKLSLDEAVLSSAMADHRDGVEAFFTSETDGSQGFAVQLDTLLEGYLKGSTGLLAAKEEGLNRSVARIIEQVGRIELRLSKREEILRRQFENLESLMADFQSTASGLDQQLQSIANLNASIAKMKR